jgi:alpha-galactosidase
MPNLTEFKNARLHMTWIAGDRESERSVPLTDRFDADGFSIVPRIEPYRGGTVLTLTLTPTRPLMLRHLSIRFGLEGTRVERMMLNGYQTWTQSLEAGPDYAMRDIRGVLKPLIGPYGDYTRRSFSRERGRLYSWSYTQFRNPDGIVFCGSFDESFAFTVIGFRFDDHTVVIEKELDDLLIESECVPLRLFIASGEETSIWDSYASLFPAEAPRMDRLTGWTSWYSLYTRISEENILAHLESVKRTGLPLDVFQIDDGFQRALGDWLTPNERFPSGMKKLAEEIRAAGFRPGLWLAPFLCERSSELYRNHPEWLLRDRRGRAIHAGWNNQWNGFFYALDPDHPEVRKHLHEVFRTVTEDWGFEFLKLDFLYSAGLLPKADRSRGRIMVEAMRFLREAAGTVPLLGCGIPLAAAAGLVEYCRIGSDVAPYWEDRFLVWARYEERISTYNSLVSTLSRWQFSGRLFGNDPDVFLLRGGDNTMSAAENHTLFLVNNLTGRIVFFSDDPAAYDAGRLGLLESMYPSVCPEVRSILSDRDLYTIRARAAGRDYTAYVNLRNSPAQVTLPHAAFSKPDGYLRRGETLTLEPHRSVCFLELPDLPADGPVLLGTTHIVPASDVERFEPSANGVLIGLKPGAPASGEAYLAVPPGIGSFTVNGRPVECSASRTCLDVVTVSYRELLSSR